MGIRAAMFADLKVDEILTGASAGLLGTAADPRIYPHRAPPGVVEDYVVYKRADNGDGDELHSTGGVRRATFDFDCVSADGVRADDIAEAIFDHYAGARRAWGAAYGVDIIAEKVIAVVGDAFDYFDGSGNALDSTTVTVRFTYKKRST